MSRKKLPRWSVRFELAPENAEDVKLHEFLDKLAENNEVSAWIRKTLAAAVPAQVAQDAQLEQDDKDEPPKLSSEQYGAALVNNFHKLMETEQKPEPKPVASMTPAEIIAANKAAARLKHPTPPSLNGGRK